MKLQLKFRLIVEEPLAGVTYAIQCGKSNVEAPKHSSKKKLTFEFPLTLADIGTEPPRLTGAYAQGPPSKRFVYVNTGTAAGQKNTCWTRRAKIPLNGIKRATIEEAMSDDVVLEARFHGIGKDGGPACATVPLTREWSIGPG